MSDDLLQDFSWRAKSPTGDEWSRSTPNAKCQRRKIFCFFKLQQRWSWPGEAIIPLERALAKSLGFLGDDVFGLFSAFMGQLILFSLSILNPDFYVVGQLSSLPCMQLSTLLSYVILDWDRNNQCCQLWWLPCQIGCISPNNLNVPQMVSYMYHS